MTQKTLDVKLAKLKADPACEAFILADAKDADMAFGISAPGKSPEHHASEGGFRSLEEYRESIRQVVRQGIVDIVLMSAHTSGILAVEEGVFEGTAVTPAARSNDTTDVHVVRGGSYIQEPSRPFQSTTIDHIQCGHVDCAEEERGRGANLGLYSVTFNNDIDRDHQTLETYKAFRVEAERKGFRHFLEVFDPNVTRAGANPEPIGAFVNDMIVRSLAGVPEAGRPVFLKMVYHGPQFMEELAAYDPSLIIGILGGSSGTTYDAFRLLADARKYGARAALFGRKINNAEHQLAFIEMLRRIADDDVSPEEAVHAYHGILQAVGIKPYRSLDDDMKLTDTSIAYGATRTTVTVAGSNVGEISRDSQVASNQRPAPQFGSMTSAERLAYHRKRLRGVSDG